MKFLYEYRTSDNAKHNGVIRAADREAAYALLKKQGIKPSRFSEAPGFFNKLFGKGKRWIAIGVLCALCLALCAVLIRTEHLAQSTRHEAQTSERHQIYGDPSIIEEIESSAYASVFTHPGERFLANFAQPGREVPPSVRCDAAVVAACVTNAIVFAADDPREVVELKRIVNGIKDELRAYLEEGAAADYIRQLWDRQREERMIYLRVLNELEGNPDPAIREERNKSLRELGLRTVPRPGKNAEEKGQGL